MAEKPTIIIKKIKKSGGHGHHGGAWKVAYADFVTAMMAFFLLLWLLSSASDEVLQGVAEYFTPTIGLTGQMGVGIKGGNNPDLVEGKQANSKGTDSIIYGAPSGGSVIEMPKATSLLDMQDNENFSNVIKDLKESMEENKELGDLADNVIIDVTPEGLRIQIVDDSNHPMFKPDSDELQPHIKTILATASNIIRVMPNYLSISGHTRQEDDNKNSKKWELSAARANAVRKFLVEHNHIDKDQVWRIVGKADGEPLYPQDPKHIKNIRISLVLMKNSMVGQRKRPLPQKMTDDSK